MKKIIQKSRFMLLLVAMMTLSLTNAFAAVTDPVYTGTFSSKAWGISTTGDYKAEFTSNKDGYQYSKPNVQITSAYTGAGATSKVSYTNIKKISIKACTTSKGVGNITVKVGDGAAQTICSLSKSSTATYYNLEYATPVSGNVTFVVNCTTNSMYVQEIQITTAAKTPSSIEVKTAPKTEYIAGEKFDPTGLVITANYDDSSTEDIAYSDDNKDDFTFAPDLTTALQTTDNKVTITYAEKSVDQTISVSAPSGKTVTVVADPAAAVTSITASPYVDVKSGDEVSLSYEKNSGYNFTSWSSDQVTVTDNKFTMPNPAVDVTVTANFAPIAVTEVQLKASTSLEVGENETLVATVLPEDALDKSLTWATADEKIATVDQSGKVIAVAAGTVNITATSTNGKVGTCAVTVTGGYEVVHDFSKISFIGWSSSYASHDVQYENDNVNFASANYSKSGSTINGIPVTKGGAVSAVLTNAKKYMSKVKFECTQWSSKAQTITLNYSKDGGATYSKMSPSVTSSNFTLTSELPDSVNAVKFTFSSSSNQVGISKLSFNMTDRQLVSSAVTITAPETTQGTLEVKKGATAIESGSNATELDTLTIVATPKSGYKVSSISVKDADGQDVTVLDNNTFVMPAKAVTVSATFESAKVLTSVEITTHATTTEFWKGETFSSDGLVLTAHFDGANDSIVTPDSLVGYNMSAAGKQTVKVYYSEGVITKYAEYTITVKTIANTAATAYSVDSAIKLVQAGKDLATKVYVKGVITSISGQNLNNVFVKDAGLTNSFEFYNLADGSTYKVEDLVVSDTIIGYGEMTYFEKSQIYEFKAGCTLEDRKAYVEIPCAIENTLETAYTVAEAIALIDQGECLASAQVYVKGVVTSISGSNIYIKDADQSNSFEFYQIVDGGAAVTDVQLYDTIAAKGYLTKWQSTYEFTAGCTLEQIKTFVPHVLSVSLNSKAETIAANGSVQLSATVLPEDAPDKSVTWSVIEGATYVSVDQTGLVSGLDAGAGTAKVRVTTTDGGFTDDCVITITAAETRKTASITGFTAVAGALTPSDITYKGEKGGASTAAAIYNNGLRLYQNGGYVTIAAVKGCKIDEVIITTNATYNSTTAAIATTRVKPTSGVSVAASSTKSFGTGMNADTAFVFCLGTTSSTRLELASIVVKYTGEPLAIDTIKVSGDFQTEFEKGADFNHDGAIVTAYYADQVTTAIVTNSATFSEPDMTTTGEKTVTVSYGGKETSYKITVSAATLDTLVLSGKYQTIFQINEAFNHTGMVVTAVYSDESEVDVTDEATFSEPDMTTAGQKEVTVSYGGKSTKYTISVKAQSGTMKKETVDFTVVYADVTTNKEVKGYSGVSFEMTCTTAGNSPTKYYANGNAVRSYMGNKIIINAVDSILAIDVKWAEGYEDDAMTIKASADGKSDTLTFSQTCRFTEITVFYQFEEKARTGLSVGQIGTICQGKNILAVRGVVLYNVEYGTTQKITFKEMQLPIAAGTPAVFQAEAADFEVIYGSKTATEAVEDENDGLVGLVQGNKVAIKEGNVLINGGKLRLVGADCYLTAGHAYIDMKEVSPTAPETPAPGRRLILTNAEAQVVTGLNAAAIKDVEMQKVIMNGQMLIIREGKMYNAQGQMMK